MSLRRPQNYEKHNLLWFYPGFAGKNVLPNSVWLCYVFSLSSVLTETNCFVVQYLYNFILQIFESSGLQIKVNARMNLFPYTTKAKRPIFFGQSRKIKNLSKRLDRLKVFSDNVNVNLTLFYSEKINVNSLSCFINFI